MNMNTDIKRKFEMMKKIFQIQLSIEKYLCFDICTQSYLYLYICLLPFNDNCSANRLVLLSTF